MTSIFLGGPTPQDGLSAYQIWQNNGHVGTEAQFLDWLKGASGQSAYDIWLANGNTGTVTQFLDSLKGDDGDSAYEIWLANGHTGTQSQFLNWLKADVSNLGVPVDWTDMGLSISTNGLQTASGKYTKIGKIITLSGIVTNNATSFKIKLPFKPLNSYAQQIRSADNLTNKTVDMLMLAGNQYMFCFGSSTGYPFGITITYITSE